MENVLCVIGGMCGGILFYSAMIYYQVYSTRKEIAELHNEISSLKKGIKGE